MATRLKSRNKTKFKITKQFIILMSLIVVLIAGSILLMIPSESEKIFRSYTQGANANSQNALTQPHVFRSISFNALEKKVNNSKDDEIIYLYYGSPNCVVCVNNIQTFNRQAQIHKIETVYYLNSDFMSKYDLDNENDKNKVNALEERIGFDLTMTPSLIVFKNGEVVFDSKEFFDEETDSFLTNWVFISNMAFGTKH